MVFGADGGRRSSGAWRWRPAAAAVVVALGVVGVFVFGRSPSSETGAGSEPSSSTSQAGGEPGEVSTTTTVDIGPRPAATVCETADCDQARLAVADLVELWWYGDPVTLADLADAAASVTTDGFREALTERGATVINKLDPDVHVVTGTEAVTIDDDLVVVLLEHRNVGADLAGPAVSHFDVVSINGVWLVDEVTTR